MIVLMFLAAIGSGVTGTLLTRASKGFREWKPAAGAIAAYGVATFMMALLLQRAPVGIVYAVWTGAAAVVLLIVDRCAFGVETRTPQLVGTAVTIAGLALLGTAAQA